MFNIFNKKKIIVHKGTFHADDIFACATISLFLEKKGERFKIIRTRDQKVIEKGDYVFDVGGVYDVPTNRFDHHQKGGAGLRENSIPYAAFGLAWKHFGQELCSAEVARRIDQHLVQPIDASDNGVDIVKPIFPNVIPYRINEAFAAFLPSALEKIDKDEKFLEMVAFAKKILMREIKKKSDDIQVEEIIKKHYQDGSDKRLLVIEDPQVSRGEIWNALKNFPEPLFAVYKTSDSWNIVAMRKDLTSFANRKDLPREWGGLRETELAQVTGVPDVIFCHNKLFLASARSKEGAVRLAQIALAS